MVRKKAGNKKTVTIKGGTFLVLAFDNLSRAAITAYLKAQGGKVIIKRDCQDLAEAAARRRKTLRGIVLGPYQCSYIAEIKQMIRSEGRMDEIHFFIWNSSTKTLDEKT